MKWKSKKGGDATFENLIEVFEEAGNKALADDVRKMCKQPGEMFRNVNKYL